MAMAASWKHQPPSRQGPASMSSPVHAPRPRTIAGKGGPTRIAERSLSVRDGMLDFLKAVRRREPAINQALSRWSSPDRKNHTRYLPGDGDTTDVGDAVAEA